MLGKMNLKLNMANLHDNFNKGAIFCSVITFPLPSGSLQLIKQLVLGKQIYQHPLWLRQAVAFSVWHKGRHTQGD